MTVNMTPAWRHAAPIASTALSLALLNSVNPLESRPSKVATRMICFAPARTASIPKRMFASRSIAQKSSVESTSTFLDAMHEIAI